MRTFDEVLGRLCEQWAARVIRRPVRAILGVVGVALALFLAGLPRFGLDSNEDILFSSELEFVPRREAWRDLFPEFRDPILVRVQGPTSDAADAAARALEQRLRQEPASFARVDRPGASEFFERHGLLYLETDELEELADRLVAAQPMLASLSRDPSLRGLSGLLGDALEAAADPDASGFGGDSASGEGDAFADALDAIASVTAAHAAGRPEALSWSDWIRGHVEASPHRLLRVQPRYAFDRVNPAGASIDRLRAVFAELGLDGSGADGVRADMTGVYVLAEEESEHVSRQSTVAGIASFLLVALVLGTGLRSARVVAAALAALASGLAATAGIAALAFGRLNLISVAFAVLFIGLSVDFAIHLGLGALSRMRAGLPRIRAIREAAGDVGGSLVVCATTTAIGFYAFGPTPYRGVAELGLIAGTGMFVSLLANLTLLPAILSLGPEPAASPQTHPADAAGPTSGPAPAPDTARGTLGAAFANAVTRARVAILLAAATLAVFAAAALPRLHFEGNPIRLREPSAPSVRLFDELLETGDALIWNMSALAEGPDAAGVLADRLDALPSVEQTVTLLDFVPEAQGERLEILDDLAFVLEPALHAEPLAPPDPHERRAALVSLRARIRSLTPAPADLAPTLARLGAALDAFLALPDPPTAALERSLLGTFPDQLERLEHALSAGPVRVETLPAEIRSEWIATDGRHRVETFPAEDLDEAGEMARYVDEVLGAAPGAYGEAYTIQRSGEAVAASLRFALGAASLGITALLLLLWRRVSDTGLVLVPIGLAALLTAGTSVWLELPLNFANVLVIPLLLGMGVDSSIHLVHRLRMGRLPGEGLLATTTARAVWLSALTTAASFGTLGLSSHPGLASLGRLLALGLAWILVCNLIVLPALLARSPRARSGRS